MNPELLTKLSGISVLLTDLEGVLIENSESAEGFDSRLSEIKSLCGEIHSLSLKFGIVTGRTKDDITERIKDETDCFLITSSFDKVSDVEKLMESHGFGFEQIMFIGDGLFDIPLLKKAGVSAAPSAARREVKRVVDIILKGKTGPELIREVLNYFKESKEINA